MWHKFWKFLRTAHSQSIRCTGALSRRGCRCWRHDGYMFKASGESRRGSRGLRGHDPCLPSNAPGGKEGIANLDSHPTLDYTLRGTDALRNRYMWKNTPLVRAGVLKWFGRTKRIKKTILRFLQFFCGKKRSFGRPKPLTTSETQIEAWYTGTPAPRKIQPLLYFSF